MATTSSNPTVTGTPVSNPNNESPATLQRKLIVLAFNLPDNIVTTSPIEDQITVTVDSVDTATFTNPELYIGTILTAGNPIDPPLKPGEFRNPNIPVEKIMSIRVEVFGNVLEYTVPANATSVKDGDTEIYLRRDDLETKLKSQVDSYRIMFESVNKQKQLYEKYNDLFQSVKGNSQENVTEEKYKELIARIAELEEQLKEKEPPKE